MYFTPLPPELTQRLRDALALWFSIGAAGGLDTNSLVYDFGDYGSGQALALDALSPGGEATQFHCLRTLAEELNCEIFLIKLKRKDTGEDYEGCDEGDGKPYDIEERIWTAEVLVDWRSGFKLDGYHLGGDVVVQDDFDIEAYDNEEVDYKYDYDERDPHFENAALIVSKAALLEFLSELSLHDNSSSSSSQLPNATIRNMANAICTIYLSSARN
ncbi:hypothetical protein PG996_001060 [Apiospora saccharicola]|uniref:Uncharacterized protein n=1 Tax=Apiospora saccharicola TaxID=335842 RepID=A0ABR1WJE8_9PEZI